VVLQGVVVSIQDVESAYEYADQVKRRKTSPAEAAAANLYLHDVNSAFLGAYSVQKQIYDDLFRSRSRLTHLLCCTESATPPLHLTLQAIQASIADLKQTVADLKQAGEDSAADLKQTIREK
jgi:hypothetical protein